MLTVRARVKNGRLVLDEPTDLPEGAEVQLAAERTTSMATTALVCTQRSTQPMTSSVPEKASRVSKSSQRSGAASCDATRSRAQGRNADSTHRPVMA
jgi:hypothetical protein